MLNSRSFFEQRKTHCRNIELNSWEKTEKVTVDTEHCIWYSWMRSLRFTSGINISGNCGLQEEWLSCWGCYQLPFEEQRILKTDKLWNSLFLQGIISVMKL